MESTTIQSETRQGKPIPVIRSNRHDINRMMGIFAAINEFELCEKEMEKSHSGDSERLEGHAAD